MKSILLYIGNNKTLNFSQYWNRFGLVKFLFGLFLANGVNFVFFGDGG